jgi:ProP effector
MFKPLKVVATPQVETLQRMPVNDSNRCLDEKADQHDQRKQMAVLDTALLLGGFRKCDASDPEIYSRTIEHTLARYDIDIQKSVADASKWKFPRQPFEVREACEAIAREQARVEEREKRIAEQLAEGRAEKARAAETEAKALAYQPRGIPARLTRAEQQRRQAEEFLARCKAEAEASTRRPHPPFSSSTQPIGTPDHGEHMSMSNDNRRPAGTEARATIELLRELYPKCFTTRLAEVRPLAIGIYQEIVGDVPDPRVKRALATYCRHGAYLRTLTEGVARIGLDGQPYGVVTAEQAATAAARLATYHQAAAKTAADAKAARHAAA